MIPVRLVVIATAVVVSLGGCVQEANVRNVGFGVGALRRSDDAQNHGERSEDRLDKAYPMADAGVTFLPPHAAQRSPADRGTVLDAVAADQSGTASMGTSGHAAFSLMTRLAADTAGTKYTDAPVWVVTFHGVPGQSISRKGPPNAARDPDSTRRYDVIFVVSAADASALYTFVQPA